jgi:2-dehydro-3-deoxygluconokinase
MTDSATAPILCFGETLLRLSAPGREMLLQSGRLDACFGGAETNVAVGLACLGTRSALVTALPDDAIGDAALGTVRGHGVDVSRVLRGRGRLGIYFLAQGAGLRASSIVYDRTGSLFAGIDPHAFDWAQRLKGVGRLHMSGITAALGPNGSAIALAAARAASEAGIPISFDGNYRAQLWAAWDSDPRTILNELVGHADLLFGNHRDVALLLGREFSGDGPDRRREAAEAAFDAFPKLKHIACTARHVDDADRHRLSARIDTRDAAHETSEVVVAGIVDRIGGGDAFAAGVLHGLPQGADAAARIGLAYAALKHSIPGDFCLAGPREVAAFLEGGFDVRR